MCIRDSNIIALLAQTFDDTALSRLEINNKYDEIYSKVTSNTVGLSLIHLS